MVSKNSMPLLVILLFGTFSFANETIVLQNGLNDYNGCSDTFLRSIGNGKPDPYGQPFEYQDENYHSETTIATAN